LSWNGILTYLTGIAISIKNGLDIKGNNKLSNVIIFNIYILNKKKK